MQIRFWRSVLYSSLEVLLKPLWFFFFLSSKPMSFAAGNLLNQQSFFFSFLSLFFFFASYLFSLQSMLQQIRLHWSKDLCCCLWWCFFFPWRIQSLRLWADPLLQCICASLRASWQGCRMWGALPFLFRITLLQVVLPPPPLKGNL